MPKPKKQFKIDPDPVLPFDNRSSDPAELLTAVEAADFLRISVTSVRRLQQQRHIPFIKVGGSLRFLRKDLVHYLRQRRVESLDK